MYYSFLFLIRESTNLHNLPLKIDNVNLYQPIFNKIMCTWIYYWGKNDHFCYYPPSDGRMRYFLGTFNILRPISLFLRVNNEGLCDGTKVRGMILLAISFFMFLEWRKNRHNIINFLNTWLFQAGLSTILPNLPLQITWTDPLTKFSTLNMDICT